MKVLEVIEGRKETGSASAALSSARALALADHSVTVLCEPGSRIAKLAEDYGLPTSEKLSTSPLALLRTVRTIIKLSAQHDILHVHRSSTHLACLLALDFSKHNRPLVRTCHAWDPRNLGIFSRWLLPRCQALIPRDQAAAASLKKHSVGCKAIIKTIPGGIDGDLFHPNLDGTSVRHSLGLDDKLLVGIVSHFKAGRQLEVFLSAAEELCAKSEFNKLAFMLIGRGKLTNTFEKRIKAKALNSRIFLLEPENNFSKSLAALDIGVLLVPGSDGSARAALEMAAAAKPLILGKVGALADFSGESEDYALSVTPDSTEDLVAAVTRIAGETELRQRLSSASKKRFEENYTMQKLGENYGRLFAQLLEEKK
jgi:glycosyltransferase involved in cell wall biosynthesis